MHIYYLETNKPVVIPVESPRSNLVLTDGFHHSKPVDVIHRKITTAHYKVVCAIDDNQLTAGLVLQVLFFFAGLTSGNLLLQMLSFTPVLYFLYLYYLNRRTFLKIAPY
jgi:hypothetical protein